MNAVRTLTAAAVAVTMIASRSIGQSVANPNDTRARWSPLAALDDAVPRSAAAASRPLLLERVLRMGLWSAGNPAGVFDDVDTAWAQLAIRTRRVSGAYKTPLEASREGQTVAELTGWRRLGARSSVVGRISTGADALSGSNRVFVQPLASSPFAPVDTNEPPIAVARVLIEGAQGAVVRGWRMGTAVAYRSLESRSTRTLAASVSRGTAAGVALGLAHPIGAVRLGGVVREGLSSEGNDMVPNPEVLRFYELDGYRAVAAKDISPALPFGFYRRAERISRSAQLTMDGSEEQLTWVVSGGPFATEEKQLQVRETNSPSTRWRVAGDASAAASEFRHRTGVYSASLDFVQSHGRAARLDSSALPFTSKTSLARAAMEARTSPVAGPWQFAALISGIRSHELIRDAEARSASDVSAITGSFQMEAARRVRRDLLVSAGIAVSAYTPIAVIPDPSRRSRSYQQFIAPALEVAAAEARSTSITIGVRFSMLGRHTVVRTINSVLTPTSTTYVPLRPGGVRRAFTLSVSIEPRSGSECKASASVCD